MGSIMEKKYDRYRHGLLDVGRRNRMINYRKTKRTTLEILEPDMDTLFEVLAVKEKPLTFRRRLDPGQDKKLVMVMDLFESMQMGIELSSGDIRTAQDLDDSQKTLKNLRSKAKSSLEEQGIQTLYVSFGFLEWTAHGSKEVQSSPLVLVPAEITSVGVGGMYSLHRGDGEIVINPTLAYVMSSDYSVDLPDFDAAKESLKGYLDRIEDMFAGYGWHVERKADLGLISFLKIVMYKDLEKNKERFFNHPVVRALCLEDTSEDPYAGKSVSGGTGAAGHPALEKNRNYLDSRGRIDHDLVPLNTTHLVVGADASQQDAIEMSRCGMSFVLQGPPGTGKSQTITNIIAQALSDGKKVLFVSEKMAALSVVYRRLQAAGLGDFCLALHNYRADKKAVISDLSARLEAQADPAMPLPGAGASGEKNRENLSSYLRELDKVRKPLGISLYQAMEELAGLADEPVLMLESDPTFISGDELREQTEALKKVEQSRSMPGHNGSQWKNTVLSMLTYELRHQIPQGAANAGAALEKLQEALPDGEISLAGLAVLIEFADMLAGGAGPAGAGIAAASAGAEGSSGSTGSVKAGSAADMGEAGNSGADAASGSSDETAVMTVSGLLREICFGAGCGECADEVIASVRNKILEAERLRRTLPGEIAEKEKRLKSLELREQTHHSRESIKMRILAEWSEDFLTLAPEPLKSRFEQNSKSFFRRLGEAYSRDRALLRSLRREPYTPVSDKQLLYGLELLEKYQSLGQTPESGEGTSAGSEAGAAAGMRQSGAAAGSGESAAAGAGQNPAADAGQASSAGTEQAGAAGMPAAGDAERLAPMAEQIASLRKEIDEARKMLEQAEQSRSDPELEKLLEKPEKLQFLASYAARHQYTPETFAAAMEKPRMIFNSREFTGAMGVVSSWFEPHELEKESISSLRRRMKECENAGTLEDALIYAGLDEKCRRLGLGGFIALYDHMTAAGDEKIKGRSMAGVYRRSFLTKWIYGILIRDNLRYHQYFRSYAHELEIREYAANDEEDRKAVRNELRRRLGSPLEGMSDRTLSKQAALLKRENEKKRRIMPLRKLFNSMPSLVTALKPCFMMSPLSVAYFLDAEQYHFDMVIFDEASQVLPEDAIGAIIRSEQVIIAGDTRQMPPTRFFMADIDRDNDDEWDEDADDSLYLDAVGDSILDEAGIALPSCTLLWHYRSRDESLIAFSNKEIYGGRLITFPGCRRGKDLGLEYIYVQDGVYEGGGKNCNRKEAETCIRLLEEHILNHPDRSLGIVAFSEKQQAVIEDAVIDFRVANPGYEFFFDENKEEPFFVKNLENVQGDERDTIIFSICYGKNAQGKMYMRFGPLGAEGGERRLNVAITRAKYNVKLVGSILPGDIDLNRTSAAGARLLREYIFFAMSSDAPPTARYHSMSGDDAFAQQISSLIKSWGYDIRRNVGASAYKVDIAVIDPKDPEAFCCAIECDGANYATGRTVRDRDITRRKLMQDMNWKIFHVWSVGWLKNPEEEKERLRDFLEKSAGAPPQRPAK